jgi:hypothetical protein
MRGFWESRGIVPTMLAWVLLGQGFYYLVTGIWPIVHMPSFLAITGPKEDTWLVRMVGALAATIGLTLLASVLFSRSPEVQVSPAILVLSVAACISFAAIDIVYFTRRVIGAVYIGDAVLQGVIVLLLVLANLA